MSEYAATRSGFVLGTYYSEGEMVPLTDAQAKYLAPPYGDAVSVVDDSVSRPGEEHEQPKDDVANDPYGQKQTSANGAADGGPRLSGAVGARGHVAQRHEIADHPKGHHRVEDDEEPLEYLTHKTAPRLA